MLPASDEAQRILIDYGFRPLDPTLDAEARDGRAVAAPSCSRWPALGGWAKSNRNVYGPAGSGISLFMPRAWGR